MDSEVVLAEGFPVVNMGFDFLKQVVTIIDQQNSLIMFEPPMKVAPTVGIKAENDQGVTNEYTGSYGGIRNILLEDGQLYVQRTGGPKLKLELIGKDYYKMTFSMPTVNELPNVRFERSSDGQIIGMTYVFADGKEDFAKKDI